MPVERDDDDNDDREQMSVESEDDLSRIDHPRAGPRRRSRQLLLRSRHWAEFLTTCQPQATVLISIGFVGGLITCGMKNMLTHIIYIPQQYFRDMFSHLGIQTKRLSTRRQYRASFIPARHE